MTPHIRPPHPSVAARWRGVALLRLVCWKRTDRAVRPDNHCFEFGDASLVSTAEHLGDLVNDLGSGVIRGHGALRCYQ